MLRIISDSSEIAAIQCLGIFLLFLGILALAEVAIGHVKQWLQRRHDDEMLRAEQLREMSQWLNRDSEASYAASLVLMRKYNAAEEFIQGRLDEQLMRQKAREHLRIVDAWVEGDRGVDLSEALNLLPPAEHNPN